MAASIRGGLEAGVGAEVNAVSGWARIPNWKLVLPWPFLPFLKARSYVFVVAVAPADEPRHRLIK